MTDAVTAKTAMPSAQKDTTAKAQQKALRTQADQALADNRLEDAEDALLAFIQADSHSAKAHRDLARIYFHTGDYESAVVHAVRWTEIDPENLRALVLLARIYRAQAKPMELAAVGRKFVEKTVSLKAALEAAQIFRGTDAISYSAAIASLEHLLRDVAERGDDEAIALHLRALSAAGDENAFWRAIDFLGVRVGPRFALPRAEQLIKECQFSEALKSLDDCDPSARDLPEVARLRNLATDRLTVRSKFASFAPSFAPEADGQLIDSFKRAEINEFVVFHVDHFEPWQLGVDEGQCAACETFAYQAARHEYTRKLTLFYCPGTPFEVGTGEPMRPGLESLGVVAPGRPPAEQSKITQAMAALAAPIELHLHIHHEDLIPCAECSDPFLAEVARTVPRARHNELLELHVRANLAQLARDTGVELESWATIHGKWALNGSDRNVCMIDDELSRLQTLGCWGDFTFPAGRRHCSPRWPAPFAVRPTGRSKAYDRLHADVRVLGRDPRSALSEAGRFFIWSSTIPYRALSLDYYSSDALNSCPDIVETLQHWISGGATDGARMFVKTHAHSMAPDYRMSGAPVFPHFFPRNQQLFAMLERVCDRAAVMLRYATVNEVRRLLRD